MSPLVFYSVIPKCDSPIDNKRKFEEIMVKDLRFPHFYCFEKIHHRALSAMDLIKSVKLISDCTLGVH